MLLQGVHREDVDVHGVKASSGIAAMAEKQVSKSSTRTSIPRRRLFKVPLESFLAEGEKGELLRFNAPG